MPSFRLFSKLNTFYGVTGQLLAGGQLRFYDAGTTTPRDVYGDSGLTTNNGVTVALDSSGRPNVDVWGEGAYFVEAFDRLGVKQGEADNVQIPGAGGMTIPALETGKFLTSNGAVMLWTTIREVPDPTGQSGKVLGTDGEVLLWVEKPADGAAGTSDMTTAAGALTFGTGANKIGVKYGSGSVPASGGHTAYVDVTFPAAFSEAPGFVSVSPTVNVVASGGYQAVCATTNISATGFRMNVDVNSSGAASDINVPIPFLWLAIGKVP